MEERAIGALLGLACGDAVGTTLEFKPRGTFEPITDMVGGGPFKLQKGQWTDDTSMALCLAHSLDVKGDFDPVDQMNRYCNWYQLGYMSSTGDCFDIGGTVTAALHRYMKTQEPYAGSERADSAGNGSIMRLAPIPIFYAHNREECIHYAGLSSRTTHGALECVDACKLFAEMILNAMQATRKDDIFQGLTCRIQAPQVEAIARGDFLDKTYQQIIGSGYVIASLEAALWCFYHAKDFSEAILLSANLGDDADTTAAICGQIAGAYHGVAGIPETWLSNLYMRDDITELARRLFLRHQSSSVKASLEHANSGVQSEHR